MAHPTERFRARYRATVAPTTTLGCTPGPAVLRAAQMQKRNFNIVLPLMDYLFGTLH